MSKRMEKILKILSLKKDKYIEVTKSHVKITHNNKTCSAKITMDALNVIRIFKWIDHHESMQVYVGDDVFTVTRFHNYEGKSNICD